LYERTGVPVETALRFRVMQRPPVVAKAAVKAMFRGKALVVPGCAAKLLALTIALTPRWALRLTRRRSARLPRLEASETP
jgi:short-subunit dehydrogenase